MNKNTELESRLISALESQDIHEVRVCVKAGAKGDVRNKNGDTVLHIAASYREKSFLEALLVSRVNLYVCDLSVTNAKYQTPVLVAAKAGNWDNVLIMAEMGCSSLNILRAIAITQPSDIMAFSFARVGLGLVNRNKKMDARKKLVRDDAEFQTHFGRTPDDPNKFQFLEVLELALKAYQPDVVKTLLRSDLRLGKAGYSPLDLVAGCMDTTMLRFFVREGYDLCVESDYGYTGSPLNVAVKNDNVHMVALLMLYRVDKNHSNSIGLAMSMGHLGCKKALYSPELYRDASIEITLFFLLTARAHNNNPLHFISIDVLKMIFRLAYPHVNAASFEATYNKAKENYIDKRPEIMTRYNKRKAEEQERVTEFLKQEEEQKRIRYQEVVSQFVEDYLYFELLQPKPVAESSDLEFLQKLMGILASNKLRLPPPEVVNALKGLIADFQQNKGSKKSRALTRLIKLGLCEPVQETKEVVEDEINSSLYALETRWNFPRHSAKEYRERAEDRIQYYNDFGGAANNYAAFILLDREDWKAQEEALKSLDAIAEKILNKKLCPALVVKALVKMMLTVEIGRSAIDAVLAKLGLEAFFSKEPFSNPPKPGVFGRFFSTKPLYTITTALAYVRIAALDDQDIEAMKKRLEDGSGNKVDEILLKAAGEFSEAMQAGQAPCLRFLINKSFREQIEALQGLEIAPEVIKGFAPPRGV